MKCETVSEEYISNCMIEAIKAKIHNSSVKIYFCKPRITENGNFQMCHFMWSDGKHSYDFSDSDNDVKRWYKTLLFKGSIRRFDKDFAKKYSNYRNQKKGGSRV